MVIDDCLKVFSCMKGRNEVMSNKMKVILTYYMCIIYKTDKYHIKFCNLKKFTASNYYEKIHP